MKSTKNCFMVIFDTMHGVYAANSATEAVSFFMNEMGIIPQKNYDTFVVYEVQSKCKTFKAVKKDEYTITEVK